MEFRLPKFNLPSSKLTWQWKFTFSNRKYIFKWWIFHSYVSLPEGTICETNIFAPETLGLEGLVFLF